MRAALVLAGALGWVGPLWAAPGGAEPATEVRFSGFGRAQVAVADDTSGVDVVMARLRGQARHHGVGELDIVVEARNPDQPLLDLVIDLNLGTPHGLKAGVFKVPFSREMLLPIAPLPTYDRTLLTHGARGLAPRRAAGVNAYAGLDLGGATLRLDGALFNPRGAYTAGDDGLLAVGRAQLVFGFGLDLHVAYLEHTLGDARDADTGAPVFPDDGQLDVALYLERGGLRALAEAIVVTRAEDGDRPWGVYGFVAYLFADVGGYGWEPALGVDHLDDDAGDPLTRVTGNLHWLVRGRALQVSAGYGVEVEGARTGHRGLLEMQGGF